MFVMTRIRGCLDPAGNLVRQWS